MLGQRLGALDGQDRHLAVKHGKGRRVGAIGVAQGEALVVEPEGEGGNEAAHAHAADLGKEHGAGGGECQPSRLEILQDHYPMM